MVIVLANLISHASPDFSVSLFAAVPVRLSLNLMSLVVIVFISNGTASAVNLLD